MTPAIAAPGRTIYYPLFDWLRFVLACAVLLGHEGLLDEWPQAGNFAVQVFFALSGWLIGELLLNLPKEGLGRFYFNRALRIWCPYFLALGMLLALALLRDRLTLPWAAFAFYMATFVYNLFGPPQLATHRKDMPLLGTGNHFWSVNAEEQFYLLSPLLLVVAPARFGRSVWLWLALALLALFTGVYASIVFGVLAAVFASRHRAFHLGPRVRACFWVLTIVAGWFVIRNIHYEFAAPFCAVGTVLLLAVRGQRTEWGAFLGGLSYPLYLNHWIPTFVLHGVFKHLGLLNNLTATILRHALSVCLAIVLAACLYQYFDRRILAARPRLYSVSRGHLAMAMGYALVCIGVTVGLILTRGSLW
jgi:peptidoglycan/LPS O-acetylase OafA/YrhL